MVAYRAVGLPDPAVTSPFSCAPGRLPLPPSPAHLRARVHPLVRFAPLQSVSVPNPPLAFRSAAPSLGSPPSSRHQPVESTYREASRAPLRSVHDVFHVLDGFLLLRPLRVCFTPLPRPGFALRGFPLSPSRTGSSPAVALMSFAPAPCRRLPDGAKDVRPPSGPCSECQSVVERGGLAHDRPAPSWSFSSLGFSSGHHGRVFVRRVLRSRPFSVLSVSVTPSLTCCFQPASPVRGSLPAVPPPKRGSCEARLPTMRSTSTADGFLYEQAPYQLWALANQA